MAPPTRRAVMALLSCTLLSSLAAAQGAIPLAEAVRLAEARFAGEVIAAELVAGRPHERAPLVYALRLLTPEGAVIALRLDAADGAFLEAEGRGLARARRR